MAFLGLKNCLQAVRTWRERGDKPRYQYSGCPRGKGIFRAKRTQGGLQRIALADQTLSDADQDAEETAASKTATVSQGCCLWRGRLAAIGLPVLFKQRIELLSWLLASNRTDMINDCVPNIKSQRVLWRRGGHCSSRGPDEQRHREDQTGGGSWQVFPNLTVSGLCQQRNLGRTRLVIFKAHAIIPT